MPKRIEKLTLQGFRGATRPVDLGFDVNKPIAMIFGENGTGKSTIVDAIDFVCNGEPGSLADRSSTHIKSHLPSLGKDAEDLQVVLSFGGQAWTARLDKGRAAIEGPDGRPRARVLRRSKILEVVNAQPKKRYEALQGFIAVPNVQKCENTLRDAAKAGDQELGEANRAAMQAMESLEGLWKAEGSPGTGYLPWARGEAAKDSAALDTEVKAAANVLAGLTACIQARDGLATAEADHTVATEALKNAKDGLAKHQAKAAGVTESLIDVLGDAETFLKENADAKNCPVCEQTVDAEQLQKRIASRLAEMKEAVELKEAVDAASKGVTESLAVVRTQQQSLASRVKELVPLLEDSALPDVAALGIDWPKFPRLLDPKSQPSEASVIEESSSLLAAAEACQAPLETSHTSSSKTLAQLNAIKGHVNAVDEKVASSKSLRTISKKLTAMLEVVEGSRKAYVADVLAGISGIVEELYLEVHPDEGIGGVRFYLNPKFQGSLEFDGKFQDATEVPPQAYYSESHLDTLGVCIFLALARHFHDGNTVVVLDDVLTSIDQAHVGRFMQMLHDEASLHNQLIITTHYRPWRERYRFARGPVGNVQLIELLHWSLPRGVRHTKTELAVEELQEVLAKEPLDRQAVSSKAGILMESLLDHLALLYECRLPRKAEPNYTLGELTGCIAKKLRKALKVQRVSEKAKAGDEPEVVSETEIEKLLTAIASINWVRNQVGCHWNVPGLEVSDTEVTEFAKLTVAFAEALVCEYCGEAPRVEKAGSYHQCGCGRTRVYPCNNPD